MHLLYVHGIGGSLRAQPEIEAVFLPAGYLSPGYRDPHQARWGGAAEVELLRCDYAARRARAGCRQYRATMIVRYVDRQGRPLKQIEVCDDHADLIIRREQRPVRDLRG